MAPARRATANIDAPVWKSYVAARIDGVPGAKTTVNGSSVVARSRKRPKPPTAESSVKDGFASKQQVTTRANVRSYWEALAVQERLQILMVDDPDIVKQLYKLNLSLLCVGLMQRHLKAGTTRASTIAGSSPSAGTKATTATPSSGSPGPTSPAAPTTTSLESPNSSDSERTYDLLEAMEFMDIGTGILTVKTELVEDVEHMFTLVTTVLHGFLTSIHVLTDSQFRDLFVVESEVINTWEDYERLIAMLVEQLMLRSYVSNLEKQALQQMEALLLEASQEEKTSHTMKSSTSTSASKKKKKKKKFKASKQVFAVDNDDNAKQCAEPDPCLSESESEPEIERSPDEKDTEDIAYHSECSTEDADLFGPSSPVKSLAKSLNRLNPHAEVFQPSHLPSLADLASPSSGKRKLDEFIINIPWQDIVGGLDEDEGADESVVDVVSGDLGCRRPRDKYRRRDEDAEIEWHLQHIYASTSAMFGWDFNEQREIATPLSDPWINSGLWRTDPREVVRYYFPPTNIAATLPTPPFPPVPIAPSSSVPPSRYYFAPPHATQHPTASGPSPSSIPYPSFLPPPSGPPVSFWEESPTPRPMFPEIAEHHGYSRLRSTKAQPSGRRAKFSHTTRR